MATENTLETIPKLILDTNVCLDWLVFRDTAFQPLLQALACGQATLVTCPAMREELSHMLRHSSLARWKADAEVALAEYDRHATLMAAPQPGAGRRLPCSDPDDQVFIDLAMTIADGAAWLVTHDRALLKLARRARARGVQVLRPRDWPGAALDPPRQDGPPAPPGPDRGPIER